MNFLEVEEWQDQKNILHGFGTETVAAILLTRLDWKGRKINPPREPLPLVSLRQVHGEESSFFGGGRGSGRFLGERGGRAAHLFLRNRHRSFYRRLPAASPF